MDYVLSCLGGITLFLLILVGGPFVDGWVVSNLWHWFVVPFFKMQELPVVYAVGFALLVAEFTRRMAPNVKEEKEETWQKWVRVMTYVFFLPLLTLVTGYLVHLLLPTAG